MQAVLETPDTRDIKQNTDAAKLTLCNNDIKNIKCF